MVWQFEYSAESSAIETGLPSGVERLASLAAAG